MASGEGAAPGGPTRGEEWLRLGPLLNALLDRGPAERAAELERIGGQDPALRARLEELLALEARAERLFSPLGGTRGPEPRAGRELGPYCLLRPIGAGGMSTVWLAERRDGHFHKRVALKLIRPGMGTEDLLRRFRTERQVLADLEHPYIARLLDGGATDDGLPYIVMEHVDGLPIDEHCRRRELPLSRRLRLFTKVCEAVQFAHQNLVVHRDLKPSNILVTASDEPRLLDFGIAKLLDPATGGREVLTQTGQQPMTLRYASPEQVGDGPITTATDVYSLGVVLYELLCGRMPYEVTGKPLVELARVVSEAAPRTMAGLPRDLQFVLRKALEKEPARRYPSAAALAADLERFLADESVTARPPSVAYRVRLFTRRHRGLVAATAVVLVSLFAGLLFSLRERGVALEARDAEASARDRADALLALSLERNLELIERFSLRVHSIPGALGVSYDMVAAALEDLERLEHLAGDDPAVGRTLVRAHVRLGDLQGLPNHANLGDSEGAVASLERARQLARPLLQEAPGDPELRELMARSARSLGVLLRARQRGEEALRCSEEAVAGFASLASEAADPRPLRRELASALHELAGLHGADGRLEEVEALAEEHRDLVEALLAEDPADREMRAQLAAGRQLVGAAAYKRGDYSAAAAAYAEARALLLELVSSGPATADDLERLGRVEGWLGAAQQQLGELDAAERHFRAAVERLEGLAARDPDNRQVPPQVANFLWSLGTVLEARAAAAPPEARSAGYGAALEAFGESLARWRELEARDELLPAYAGLSRRVEERIDQVLDALEESGGGRE